MPMVGGYLEYGPDPAADAIRVWWRSMRDPGDPRCLNLMAHCPRPVWRVEAARWIWMQGFAGRILHGQQQHATPTVTETDSAIVEGRSPAPPYRAELDAVAWMLRCRNHLCLTLGLRKFPDLEDPQTPST